jgi:hypothetical protein
VFLRVPVSTLLAAFAWGALLSLGFARACSGLAVGTAYGYLQHGNTTSQGADLTALFSELTDVLYRLFNIVILHYVVFIQLMQAAGVLLVLFVFRHRITDLTPV